MPESEWKGVHIFQHTSGHTIPKRTSTGKRLGYRRRQKKKFLATGNEVRRQVLLPAAEKQAWKRKEVGRFNGGRLGIWVSRW